MHERPVLRLHHLHRRLKREIEQEQTRRLPDVFRVARLKKIKHAVKDRLARRSAPYPSPA
jgi:hypothetical protein